MDRDDRRLFVVDCPEKPHSKGDRYYARLHGWSEEAHNVEALAGWLMSVDLEDWSPYGSPPQTSGKRHMVATTRGALETRLLELIEEGKIEPYSKPIVTASEIFDHISSSWRELNCKTKHSVGRALGQIGFEMKQVEFKDSHSGRRRTENLWILDNDSNTIKLFLSLSGRQLYEFWRGVEKDPFDDHEYTEEATRSRPEYGVWTDETVAEIIERGKNLIENRE